MSNQSLHQLLGSIRTNLQQMIADIDAVLPAAPPVLTPERREFLHDVIVTAVEGGINYWAYVSEYKFSDDSQNASVRVFRDEPDDIEGYPKEGKVVTIESINESIIQMLHTPIEELGIHSSFVNNVLLAHNNNDAAYLDAGDCDNIFQFALLGKVIYG